MISFCVCGQRRAFGPQRRVRVQVVRIEGGFRVTDVWKSHEAADRFGDEIMR